MRPTKLMISVILLVAFIAAGLFVFAEDSRSAAAARKPLESAFGVLNDIAVQPDGILLRGNNIGSYTHFKLSDPTRLVIDIKDSACALNRSSVPVNGELVQQVRVSQFSPKNKVRVVFDLRRDISGAEIQRTPGGLLVQFTPVATSAAARKEDGVTLEIASSKAAPVVTDGTSGIIRIPEPVVKPKAVEPVRTATAVPLPDMKQAPGVKLLATKVESAKTAAMVSDDSEDQVNFSGEPITVDVVDVPIVDFFRWMGDNIGLNIVVDPSVSGTISMKVNCVPWDQVFDLALKNNRLAKLIEGEVIRIGTMDSFKDEEKARQELKRARYITTKTIRANYATVKDLASSKILNPILSQSGEINFDERTNTIVIRDIPERIKDVEELIKVLDVPEHQVEIEARIIAANRSFARSIGVQLGFVGGNLQRMTVGGPNTFAGIGGYRPAQTPNSAYVAGNAATGRGAATGTANQGAGVSTGADGKTGNWNINLPAIGATSGIGLSIGNILDTFLLDASLTAAESSGQVMVISQPKVQAQNNRKATIEQGLQIPVQTSENNTTTVRFFSASLKLEVTPRVTEDGNVFLNIALENNRADFTNTVNGIPSIITSQSATEVLVGDGGTTVMGGVLIDEDIRSNDKVPLLGDIPLLGHLFRRDSKQKDTKEILFFLTPRIIR